MIGWLVLRNRKDNFDFRPIGHAIKEARIRQGLTRKQVGEIIKIAPRYLINIENKGQHPSVQVLYELVNLLDISIDGLFLTKLTDGKSNKRKQVERQLDYLNDNELTIVNEVIQAIFQI